MITFVNNYYIRFKVKIKKQLSNKTRKYYIINELIHTGIVKALYILNFKNVKHYRPT